VKITDVRATLLGADHLRTTPRDDLERVRVVREVLGPDRALMVDVDTCWDVPTALRLGRQLEELDVAFLEEPISADDVAGSARLAAALDLPIAGYETEVSPAACSSTASTPARSWRTYLSACPPSMRTARSRCRPAPASAWS